MNMKIIALFVALIVGIGSYLSYIVVTLSPLWLVQSLATILLAPFAIVGIAGFIHWLGEKVERKGGAA